MGHGQGRQALLGQCQSGRHAQVSQQIQLTSEDWLAIEREYCARSLPNFVERAWHVLEPNQKYVHGWHVDAICEHLQAVADGQINRLLINVPPGSSKSLLTSVFLNAWEWGPKDKPSLRYLTTSYNDKPVKRDTRKCRDLILSEWYQALWPEVQLTRTGETSFANSKTGSREGSPFGSLTSLRGDRLIIDDPHSTETAESDAERLSTTRKFREGAQNRLNDQEASAIVVIMQRLHAKDVSGVIKDVGMDYVTLCLPMEFERENRCVTVLGFKDPRTKEGELLDPVRVPKPEIDKLKIAMGSYAWAGQYQQRPVPRGGGMFKREWFEIVPAAPAGIRWVRGWDLAATDAEDNPDAAYTAGVKLGIANDGTIYVGHCVRGQLSSGKVTKLIGNTASQDGYSVPIDLPQDPGQAGKSQVRAFVQGLMGYTVHYSTESGDKETRAQPFASQAEAGNVKIVQGSWNEAYLDEIETFPAGAFKDQVDATSRAFARLIIDNSNNDEFGAPIIINGDGDYVGVDPKEDDKGISIQRGRR